MKIKFLIITFLIISVTNIQAKNISVKSFRMLGNDMDARINYPKIDQNGEKCALIKVVTNEQGFVWEGDALGITDVSYKTSEYWLYVPRGAKRLTIKHSKLGMLRNYVYPLAIKEATVYELVLTTNKVTTIVEEYEIPTQWLVISSEPDRADVYINNQYVGLTPFQAKKEIGSYNYRIEKSMYHVQAGKIELSEEKRKILNINLKANYGYVKINTLPEQGAFVEIDGISMNSKTPYTSKRLSSGKHKLSVKKVLYKPKTFDFIINDKQTTNLDVDLEANFSTINITTSPEADIYIDDKKKAYGSYSGRLMPGLHTFEASKNKHYNDKKQKKFIAGGKVDISLHVNPKTGDIDIITKPFGAKIILNDKLYGTTPKTIKDLLIGDYNLHLTKDGYGDIIKLINIKENDAVKI
ncbi:MAG: PEGA domain-containing protein, partial [Bacteroidota bacterium]|nr:PEGA domain-containing protein [Bacteroidota bacterium]